MWTSTVASVRARHTHTGRRRRSSRLLAGTAVVAVALLPGLTALAANQDQTPPSRYMGGPAELVTAPNGAIVYDPKGEIDLDEVHAKLGD